MTVYRITGKNGTSATLDCSLESAKRIADTMNGTITKLGLFPGYFHTMSKWEAMWWAFMASAFITLIATQYGTPSIPLMVVNDIFSAIITAFAVGYIISAVYKRIRRKRKG